MQKKCLIPDCNKNAYGMLWNGKPYCSIHYFELMTKAFDEKWSRWENGTQPSDALRSLMGRLLDEKWTVQGGMLSNARIRDRGFNFQKNDEGFTFEITRHPGAFKTPGLYSRVVQKWKIQLHDQKVEFIEERDWSQNDPE
jgi:hypothetical protein